MPRLSKIGAAALAAFGWTGLNTVSASYLVVAGGGGGGFAMGGGGGAGGYQSGTTSLVLTTSYTVTIGAGGAGATSTSVSGVNGSNSSFGILTASVGGGGGGSQGSSGVTGGSGGGAGANLGLIAGSGTSSQGFAGGLGTGSNSGNRGGGGGGGSSAVGVASTSGNGGNGGAGTANSISGSSVSYAGGGGAGCGRSTGTAGVGTGGGGSGVNDASNATSGTANTGGGGGGGGESSGFAQGTAGAGGSGVVIISYVGAQQFGGGVVTSSGGNTIHTFTTSGTLSPLNSLTASYLVVAGGAGGGSSLWASTTNGAGGGGAGGLLSGSGITIDTNSIYVVTVGAGGSGSTAVNVNGSNGTSSILSIVSTTAVGGGGGGSQINSGGVMGSGQAGGSGGGGCGAQVGNTAGGAGAGTSGQGNNGGAGLSQDPNRPAGGGGGSGGAGVAGSGSNGGNGGVATISSISGTSTYYAGGGGGGVVGGTAGLGGGTATTANKGGAGDGAVATASGGSATANTGGGGGGAAGAGSGNGGNGGSGIVIISYPGSTQQMAGGTVTVSGGNVIHTFTSSGYLAPIYSANNSLRFRASNNNYLARTYGTPTNNKVWTWSAWVKRGSLSLADANHLFMASPQDVGSNPTTYSRLIFETDNTLRLQSNGSAGELFTSSAVYRDPAAWYHIVLSMNASSTVVNCFVNGTEIAYASRTNPTNTNTAINGAGNFHRMGFFRNAEPRPFDGYMAEVNFIDGQALTPNSFGTSNGLGVWQPIRYGGSYGNNGFYLKFTDTTSTTTLGYDSSPNSNNWTTNNISLTAGSTYDSMTDVPTLTSATTANYAVINPLDYNATYLTLSAANLQQTYAGVTAAAASRATMVIPTTGKYYWEVTLTTIGTNNTTIRAGICSPTTAISGNSIDGSATSYLQITNGQKRNNATDSTYGAGFSNGQILQVLYDATAGSIYFGQNNSFANGSGSFNQAFSGATAAFTGLSGEFMPCFITYGGSDIAVNFGQRPFSYTPPTGFVALNTFNLPTPTIGATASTTANKYMDATLYTGNGSTQTITNSGSMQPDFVWVKSRNAAVAHALVDSVRGVDKYLYSSLTIAEETQTNALSSFNSNGFSLAGSFGNVNANGTTYVAWQWRASNATAVTNTAGSITSTVSANTSAGFSIVTYTGTGSNATVGHGLGVAPSMIIIKNRSTVTDWPVYHGSNTTSPATQRVLLNTTDATATSSTYWNNTAPTSSVFSISTYSGVNGNTNAMVAYCFAQVAGYSAFGSYTGNGSTDGPFIFTGFRPRFVMTKKTNSTSGWGMVDTSINPNNQATTYLQANTSGAVVGGTSSNGMDMLSNGFKIRSSDASFNETNGDTYIYAAFAENPFKYANAR